MKRYFISFVFFMFIAFILWGCIGRNVPVHPRDNPYDPGGINFHNKFTARIYENDGRTPAAGVIASVYISGSIDTVPLLRFTTDDSGFFDITDIPPGSYNLIAEQDSFMLYQKFFIESSVSSTLHDDTLECKSILKGKILIEGLSDRNLITIRLPGTGKPPICPDSSGDFMIYGLSSGIWSVLFSDSLKKYMPVSMIVEVAECATVIIADTVRLFRTCRSDRESFSGKNGGYYIYYGDLHNHTNISDGSGTPAEAYYYARNKAGLDFFAISDHCLYLSPENWKTIREAADGSNEDSVFVALWGFEWTSSLYGHCTVIGTDDYCSAYDPSTDSFSELCSWLSARDGAAFFNHPGRLYLESEFNLFSDTPSEKFVGMELWNNAYDFRYYYNNDGFFPNDNRKGFFDEALSRGWKIGAAGSGDNHSATWGTANDFRLAVIAAGLTREEIMSALRNRMFYSTLDKNLMLSFTIDNKPMGSTVRGGRHTLRIIAEDCDCEKFSEYVVYNSDHNIVRAGTLNSGFLDISFDYKTDKDDYCYVIVKQVDADEAISSPVWIESEADE